MTVTTNYGKIQGVDMGDYTVYKGVPYAKPPIGGLRWKAPVPVEPWDGVFVADTFGNCCVHAPASDELYGPEFYSNPEFLRTPSEDCLYINIWVPNHSEGKKLPVAFWVHGGAFLGGYNSEMEFDGEAYCSRGVILVSVEYRCNIFGFLAHPWLSEENELGISGNYGMLDQVAALKWVYENIRAFGGDPENITVFGQSAGAMSCQTLVSSPLTGNMIAKAIFQSGGGYDGGLNQDLLLKTQENYGLIFSDLLGVDCLEQMREKSQAEIFAALGPFMEKVFPLSGGLFLTPTVDGHLLEEGYNEAFDLGHVKDIPYMLGTTKDDILVTEALKAKGEFSSLYHGCIRWSQKLEQMGRKPAYVYYFAHDLPGNDAGAFHSAELWYMFGTLGRCWRPMNEADYELSAQMLDYWTNFMKTGNPNADGLAEWNACTINEPFVRQFL